MRESNREPQIRHRFLSSIQTTNLNFPLPPSSVYNPNRLRLNLIGYTSEINNRSLPNPKLVVSMGLVALQPMTRSRLLVTNFGNPEAIGSSTEI